MKKLMLAVRSEVSKLAVIPAKAGIQSPLRHRDWIPAFAGMTSNGFQIKYLISLFVLTAAIYYLPSNIAFLHADEKKQAPAQEKIVEEKIKSSVNKVLGILKDTELSKETKREEVMKVIEPLFDIPLMGKLVLGRKHWPKFTEAQQKEFTNLFIKALQDSYFDKVYLLTDETVEFDAPEPAGDRFQMLTHIIAKDKRYKMLFKLYKKEGNWLVYDVEIEGISFVRSYGAQYAQFLEKNSPKALLARLREKTLDVPEELKSKMEEEVIKESVEKSTP